MEFNLNNFKMSIEETKYSIVIKIINRNTSETLREIIISKQELLDDAIQKSFWGGFFSTK